MARHELLGGLVQVYKRRSISAAVETGIAARRLMAVDSGARCNGSMRSGFARLCQVL
jgi:hypothetical protein